MTEATMQPGAVIASALWPAGDARARLLRGIVLATLGSAVIALSAQISVPFWPVPLTMQTLAVLGLGALYGPRLGAATLILYLLEGLAGLPVFANGASGAAIFAGTTGGYLVGFVFAAGIVGRLAELGWDRTPLRTVAAMIIGNLTIYLCGIAWLTQFLARMRGLPLDGAFLSAVNLGALPFLLGDGLKILLATALLWGAWQYVGARR